MRTNNVMAKKPRLRWKRLIGLGILGYLLFWSGHSALQMWHLSREEVQVRSNIAAATRQNQVLQQELAQLKNPGQLKKILQGTAPIPGHQP